MKDIDDAYLSSIFEKKSGLACALSSAIFVLGLALAAAAEAMGAGGGGAEAGGGAGAGGGGAGAGCGGAGAGLGTSQDGQFLDISVGLSDVFVPLAPET